MADASYPRTPGSFQSTSGASINQDIISVKNLQLPAGVVAPDVWGKPKEQPALLTITLVLNGGFASAASKDALDGSTIHYGELSKRIRSACGEQGQTAGDVSAHAERVICEMARKGEGKFIVARSVVEVNLPKASMYGDGATLINTTEYDEAGRARAAQRVFVVKEVKLMLLVGVNGYERTAKQPIIAGVWLYLGESADGKESGSAQTAALFNLEQTLVQITQDTSFETLESLADFTVTQLQKRLLSDMLPGSQVQLRFEKPRAIAFADAPAVEVFRQTPCGGSAKRVLPTGTPAIEPDADGTTAEQELSVIRPYV
ncbi:hypothetical protein LTR56_006051 [Elasticomyces elasticus]|nr:hypothetical protein LTR56_006051 [Elasticomyces elasticus]KAK3668988.1 hypothetical protein LTR22_000066 [Elasticomyces elasticus]KAK4922712.1 hypothetical protein LTR49_010069 [Elasticomyces elasticus]KAK5760967.1 hypothetical protein LTS12_008972 [Elasticomyces elasticus]